MKKVHFTPFRRARHRKPRETKTVIKHKIALSFIYTKGGEGDLERAKGIREFSLKFREFHKFLSSATVCVDLGLVMINSTLGLCLGGVTPYDILNNKK